MLFFFPMLFTLLWLTTMIIHATSECRLVNILYLWMIKHQNDIDELEADLNLEGQEDSGFQSVATSTKLYWLADVWYSPINNDSELFPVALHSLVLETTYQSPGPADVLRVADPQPLSLYPMDTEWVLQILTTLELFSQGQSR